MCWTYNINSFLRLLLYWNKAVIIQNIKINQCNSFWIEARAIFFDKLSWNAFLKFKTAQSEISKLITLAGNAVNLFLRKSIKIIFLPKYKGRAVTPPALSWNWMNALCTIYKITTILITKIMFTTTYLIAKLLKTNICNIDYLLFYQ